MEAQKFWMQQSGQFTADGKVVLFDVKVQESTDLGQSLQTDQGGNSLIVDDSALDSDENRTVNGTTKDGKKMNVRSSRLFSETPAHEMGHAFGLLDSYEGNCVGLMWFDAGSRNADTSVYPDEIQTMINNAVSGKPEMNGKGVSAGRGFVKGTSVQKVKSVKKTKR